MKSFKEYITETFNIPISSIDDINKFTTKLDKNKLKSLLTLATEFIPVGKTPLVGDEKGNIKIRARGIKDIDGLLLKVKQWKKDNSPNISIGIGNGSLGGSKENTEKELSGADWEHVIVASYNMLSNKNTTLEDAISLGGMSKGWKPYLNDKIEDATKIVESAFGNTPDGVMKHYGSGSADVTKDWEYYFLKTTHKTAPSTTKTPKTDIYIGDKHISVKKSGNSQLMSGGISETLATLAFAYKNIPENIKIVEFEQAWNELTRRIESEFIKIKLPPSQGITDLKKQIESGENSSFLDTVKKALINNSSMTDALNRLVEKQETKIAVVKEAMTGYSKFIEDMPKSNHILVFNETGKANFHKIDDTLVSHYASITKFNINFKTGGTGGTSSVALRLNNILKVESTISLNNIIEESFIVASDILLTEGILTTTKNFLTLALKHLWSKIKALLIKGLEYVISLFGMEVSANSPIINFSI